MKRFILPAMLVFGLCSEAIAADISGKYVMNIDKGEKSTLTVKKSGSKYMVNITADCDCSSVTKECRHGSFLEGTSDLNGNILRIKHNADPDIIPVEGTFYEIAITFDGKKAIVKELGGNIEAIVNASFGPCQITGSYKKVK